MAVAFAVVVSLATGAASAAPPTSVPPATALPHGGGDGASPTPRHVPSVAMPPARRAVATKHPLRRHKPGPAHAERSPQAPAPAPASQAAGSQAAPVPDPTVEAPVPVTPDTIHTTPKLFSVTHDKLGDGYTYGSSSSALEDRNTAKTPGVAVAIPFK